MYKKVKNIKKKKGFALFYVILIIGVMLIATSIFLDVALEELFLSADREESDIALYMAEAGVECAVYHQRKYGSFNSLSDPETYWCDPNSSFEAGWSDADDPDIPDIQNTDYPDNSSCFYGEDPTPIFGLGLDPNNYTSSDVKLISSNDPIVIHNDKNDSCARVFVEVRPRKRESLERVFCEISIRSEGASECDSDGNPVEGAVERTRIENRTD
ncbi:MAG: hypothetical protein ACLFNR_01980 [Candidatus Paceibacterota bacterium]